jgi:hypothetical protein
MDREFIAGELVKVARDLIAADAISSDIKRKKLSIPERDERNNPIPGTRHDVDFNKIRVTIYRSANHERWIYSYDYNDYEIHKDGRINLVKSGNVTDSLRFPIGTYEKIMKGRGRKPSVL